MEFVVLWSGIAANESANRNDMVIGVRRTILVGISYATERGKIHLRLNL
jgi:hypothetical protein